jgi:protein-disulfide isomerase
VLQQDATGPYKGSVAKDLELVEFADFQCPHCKEAQANMDKLAADFPKAHIVFQHYPLERIHPEAKIAAEYGVCVTKQGGSNAFFQFADAVFQGQDGLGTADGATLTLNSAVTKAGLDPTKIAACVATPAVGDEVEKSVKLAEELNITQTPTLMINGRQVPIGGVPYDMLKKIVEYQEKLDGIAQ